MNSNRNKLKVLFQCKCILVCFINTKYTYVLIAMMKHVTLSNIHIRKIIIVNRQETMTFKW